MPYALAIQGTCWLERIKEPSPAHTRVTKLLSLKSTYLTAERANDSVLQKFAWVRTNILSSLGNYQGLQVQAILVPGSVQGQGAWSHVQRLFASALLSGHHFSKLPEVPKTHAASHKKKSVVSLKLPRNSANSTWIWKSSPMKSWPATHQPCLIQYIEVQRPIDMHKTVEVLTRRLWIPRSHPTFWTAKLPKMM